MKRKLKTKQRTKWETVGGRVHLAGVIYSDYQQVAKHLKPGTVLTLIGEPSNEHDRLAIRVEYKGVHIGYVPARSREQFAAWEAHKEGRKLIAVLTGVALTNPTWHMFVIQIKATVKTPTVSRVKF